MRRLERWAFNILAGLSLLVFVAVCVLWVRGFRKIDGFAYRSPGAYYECFSYQGGFWLGCIKIQGYVTYLGLGFRPLPIHEKYGQPQTRVFFGEFEKRWGGFGHQSASLSRQSTVDLVVVPCWFPAAALSAAPAYRLAAALRRSKRRKLGLCPVCSYDLRATADRCPECGHETHRPGAAS